MNKEMKLDPETREALRNALGNKRRRHFPRANIRIREAMTESGLRYWQLADLIGIGNSTLTIWMRHEMPEEKQEMIIQLIKAESERLYG